MFADVVSSPRSWGTPFVVAGRDRIQRFIPTLVGNADGTDFRQRVEAVHPHARGERFDVTVSFHGSAGSSPRSWGTLLLTSGAKVRNRFIPTLVGNAYRAGAVLVATPVHPHARGERSSSGSRFRAARGSSPRSWGTQEVGVTVMKVLRFIPTLVGNAGQLWIRFHTPSVHPHARGERLCIFWGEVCVCGSSPRSWGTRI